MTKQEEIREEIKRLEVYGKASDGSLRLYHLDDEDITQLLTYLHSQGVVIKVERKLPTRNYNVGLNASYRGGLHDGYGDCLEDMLKAGYVPVEPLIEENPRKP